MADLATVDDLTLLLGLAEGTDEDLLQLLLDGAEALFESDAARAAAPFQSAQTGRVEILEGRRSRQLWLDYPVQTVTAIALGVDVNSPTETLTPGDATKVVWRAGSRRLTRTDGGHWQTGDPSYVKVTYDAQADLPEDAKLAILKLAAAMYQRGGTEGVRSETLDTYSVTFAHVAQEDPAWQLAVNYHRRLVAA